MNLQKIIDECQDGFSSITDYSLIATFKKFEQYVTESYSGRLFFELIQNARDAAFEQGVQSQILIKITDDKAYFANTGKPFTEAGVRAMARLGVSPKDNTALIGHKGIGFKAIQEYTKSPKIVTAFGSVYFSRLLFKELLEKKFPGRFNKEKDVPLFGYPFHSSNTIKDYSDTLGGGVYDTIIEFALDKNKNASDLKSLYSEITDEELVLLGSIGSIRFEADGLNHLRRFTSKKNIYSVESEGAKKSYQVFTPQNAVLLPDDILTLLDEEEQEVFRDNRKLDIRIVFNLGTDGTLLPVDSKLFLFYPLEIDSGFSYIIHSNFSCNPERTSLRATPLNSFLFNEIAKMQIGVLLPLLKKEYTSHKILDFLRFEKKDHKLMLLYDAYSELLEQEQFIWLEQEKRFAGIAEVFLCNPKQYALLKTHTIKGLHLVSLNEKSHKFLRDHFDVPVLTKVDIAESSEAICQAEIQNPDFFTLFYEFCIDQNIDISRKNILLGQSGGLFSRADEVFYAVRIPIKIPEQIASKLVVLHKEVVIKPEYVSAGSKYLGIKEFLTLDVVKRALALQRSEDEDKLSMLYFLFGINDSSDAVRNVIRQEVLVPVRRGLVSDIEWIIPLYHPVYFPEQELLELYPEGYFIEIALCLELGGTIHSWEDFFLRYGVWKRPAVYFQAQRYEVAKARVSLLNSRANKRANSFYVYNDRLIDFPTVPNHFFFNAIVNNWQSYINFIESDILPFTVRSSGATYGGKPERFPTVTSFAFVLREREWIQIPSVEEKSYRPGDVVGLNKLDAIQERHLLKFLSVLPIDYQGSNITFAALLGIAHFNAFTVPNIISILQNVSHIYSDREASPLDSEFKRFYHTLLKYLYHAFARYENNQAYLIQELKKTKILCRNMHNGDTISWQYANMIYHIDDRLAFEQLSPQGKEILQYVFTKSDRNEIGKVFARAGKLFSSQVKSRTISSNPGATGRFIDRIKNLPYVILAVEDTIEEHLSEQAVAKLKNVVITEYSNLEKETSIQSHPDFKDLNPLRFYFDSKSNVIMVHKDFFPLESNRSLLSEIIDVVFSSIVGKDINRTRLIRDLLAGTSSGVFQEALKDFDFDIERLQELKALFMEEGLSPQQLFWSTVLHAKGLTITEHLDNEGGIKLDILEHHLGGSTAKIHEWYNKFQYLNFSAEANHPLLREILKTAGISLKELNSRLNEPVNFVPLYRRWFDIRRNKSLPSLKVLLYQFLKTSLEQQGRFLELINSLEKLEPVTLDINLIDFDVQASLADVVSRICPGFSVKGESIKIGNEESWKTIEDIATQNRKKLLSMLKAKGANLAYYEVFLLSGIHQSLLYFGQVDFLENTYFNLYPKVANNDQEGQDGKTIPGGKLFEEAIEDNKNIEQCSLEDNNMSQAQDPLENALSHINPSNKKGSRGGSPTLPNQDYLRHIGRQGEKLLYLKLANRFGVNQVRWVSENSTLLDFVPDKEAVGYDIRYIDENNITHYVEVKTSLHEEPEFHISINEVRAARKYGSQYHVVWISNLFNTKTRRYLDLGNMFETFVEGEDFFHNRKFYPQLTAFKIIFKHAVHPDTVESSEAG